MPDTKSDKDTNAPLPSKPSSSPEDPIPSPRSKSPSSTQDKFLTYAQSRLASAEAHTSTALSLRQRASSPTSSLSQQEKDALLAEAAEHEKKSKQEMKAVERLQSGVWQGAGMGGGIGAGVGMGLGAVVGTVVGGVVSVPAAGVGVLAGAGTGAVHGAWFEVPGGKGMGRNREEGDGKEKGGGKEES